MQETVAFALGIAGAGFVAMYLVGALLGFVVALRSRPARRAIWTAGIAFVAVSIILVAAILVVEADPSAPGAPFPVDPFLAPALLLPGAMLVYLLEWWGFRARWVDDETELRPGEQLAHDDWRIGLCLLAIFVLTLAAGMAWRIFWRLS